MKTDKDHIPDILFISAQGFYQIGINTALSLDSSPNGYDFTQKLVPAAVNICFAAELLMKGLILISEKKPKSGHSLTDLFNHLSKELRDFVVTRYNHYQVVDKDNKSLSAFKMVIYKRQDEKDNTSDDENIHLHKLLQSHDRGFEKWRYVFEIDPKGFTFEIDFKSMNCFIQALVDAINSIPFRQKLVLTAHK